MVRGSFASERFENEPVELMFWNVLVLNVTCKGKGKGFSRNQILVVSCMAYPAGLHMQTCIDRRVGAHFRSIALSPQVDESIIVYDGWPALFTDPAVTCATFDLRLLLLPI